MLQKGNSPLKISLWGKIWKSLVALSVFGGILGFSNVRLEIPWVIAIVAGVIMLMIYWHIIEITLETQAKRKQQFDELCTNVKFIRQQLEKRGEQ